MSGSFQQVMHELGITQYKSSPYHPESQGVLERFHQTLKNMIRSYCFDTEKDWDEGIHLLLFAVRESVQESLGFSPFELVFGHTVRGPLKLLKEKFLSNDDSSLNLPAYGVYVSQLIRYARTCSNYQDFMERGKVLTQKLLSQGYQKTKLVATLKKFYGRHHDLVNPYNLAVSRIVSDVFASDAP